MLFLFVDEANDDKYSRPFFINPYEAAILNVVRVEILICQYARQIILVFRLSSRDDDALFLLTLL